MTSFRASLFTCATTALCLSSTPNSAQDATDNWALARVVERVSERTLQAIGDDMSASDEIRMRQSISPRIVGGDDAEDNENPFQVGLLLSEFDDDAQAQFCGGALIAPTIVVTAAHCSDFVTADQVQVLTGTRDLDGSGERQDVASIVIHPDFDTVTLNNDAAVWHLASPVHGIAFAMLTSSDGPVGGDLLVTGWGRLNEGGPTPTGLQAVNVPLVDRTDCNDGNSYNGAITNQMLCAGRTGGGTDSCQGDSGGPLTGGTNNMLLTGIVSWGIGCARPNLFGVYTRVSNSSIRDFITDQSYFARQWTIAAGGISRVSVADVTGNRFVAAVRDSGGDLRLIAFDVADSGAMTRRGTATAGEIREVSVAPLSSGRVVAAMRDGDGNLRLITFDVSSQGNLTRRGTATAGSISRVAVAPLEDSRIVTAMRDGDGNLRLIAFDVADDGSVTRRGSFAAGRISEVDIVALSTSRVVAAMRDEDDNLRLITFDVNEAGAVTRRGTYAAGSISAVSMSVLGDDRFVAAMRDGEDNLRLISFDVVSDGELVRRGTAAAGTVSEMGIAAIGPNRVVATMRDGGGELRLIAYGVASNGTMTRLGTGTAGGISALDQAVLGTQTVVTTMRDSHENLRVISWGVPPN